MSRRGLDDYEPVEDRIRRFWADHPEGRILTELVHHDERQYIVRAEVYTDREDVRPAATGYAEEIVGSNPVNKTNALENGETSAIGRALANLNYAPKGARPSREEMAKATRDEQVQRDPATYRDAALADDMTVERLRNLWQAANAAGLLKVEVLDGQGQPVPLDELIQTRSRELQAAA